MTDLNVTNRPPSRCNRAAWTLAELLITIAVLAVLMAILLPVMGRVREKARTVECMTNLRSYGTAVMAFIADHNQSLPDRTTPDLAVQNPLDYPGWVQPYVGKPLKELRCPLVNAQERDENRGFAYNGNGSLPDYYPRLTGIPVPPSRLVLAAEMYTWSGGFSDRGHFNRTIWGNATGGANPADEGQKLRPQYHGSPAHRGLHLFFLDGHIKLVSAQDNDWAAGPTYGDATNGGYFYDRRQFDRMKRGKLIVQ